MTPPDDSDDTTRSEAAGAQPAPVAVVPQNTHVVVDELSPEAIESLRRHVEDANGGGSRIAWFLIGFLAAIVAGIVAAIVALAVSDADDDGDLELDVPSVEVDVEQ